MTRRLSHLLAGRRAGPCSRWLRGRCCDRRASRPSATRAGESAVKIAPPAVDTTTDASGTQTAVFAGGCFWGVQGVFQRVNGVVQAVSGYSGGAEKTAHVRDRRHRPDRPRRVGEDHLRPEEGELRHAAADLLLGRARPDAAQPPGARQRPAVPLGGLLRRRRRRRRRPSATSPSSTRPRLPEEDRHPGRAAGRRSIRPRRTTRTT